MSFQHPFQTVQQLGSQGPDGRDLLFAAAGSKIYTFDVDNGRQLSVWPQDLEPQQGQPEPVETSPKGDELDSESQGPPEKRRKLSSSGAEKPGDSQEDTRKDSGKKGTSAVEWTTIPILTTSADGKHLIAVTGEDKCIRVFDVDKDGKLVQLSGR